MQNESRNFLALRLVSLIVALALPSIAIGGLMTDANYANPVTYQQHLSLGASYKGTVVNYQWGATVGGSGGSGVLAGNRRCVLVTAHEVEDAGRNLDPIADNLQSTTGMNYLSSPGLTIPVIAVIKHPARTAPGAGTDLALLVLAHDIPGGVPAEISTVDATVGTNMALIGFGKQATPNIPSFITGDLIGGWAPITNVDTRIRTAFDMDSPIPLIYNGNKGDSGGGLFGANRKLYGILSFGSTPNILGFTYAVDVCRPENYNWIQQQTSIVFSIPYVPSVKPELTPRIVGTNILLKTNQSPLQEGGRWVLQTSPDIQTWTPSSVVFTPSADPGYFECLTPLNGPSGFFRLKWESD